MNQPNTYTKDELMKKLNQNGAFIEIFSLNSIISELKIDAIFENADNEEIFDELAYEKILNELQKRVEATVQSTSEPVQESFSHQPQDIIESPKQSQLQPLEQVSPPTRPTGENTFKLDISENTLNMVAISIARKIIKQVGVTFGNDTDQTKKIALHEEYNKELEARLNDVEADNRKLRLLLREANQNLNLYKPTAFGLYKFTGKKRR